MAETLTVLLVAVLLWAVYGYLDAPRPTAAPCWSAPWPAWPRCPGPSWPCWACWPSCPWRPAGLGPVVPSTRARWPWPALAGVVVLAPWTVYNAGRFDEPVLISTNDGLTLIGANCDRAVRRPGPRSVGHRLPAARLASPRPRPAGPVAWSTPTTATWPWSTPLDNLGDLPRVAAIRMARTWSLYDPASMIRFNENEGREPPCRLGRLRLLLAAGPLRASAARSFSGDRAAGLWPLAVHRRRRHPDLGRSSTGCCASGPRPR